MDPRINVVTLGVDDLDRSLAFYRDGLGWRAEAQGDIAFLSLNGIVLALYPRGRLAADAGVPADGAGFPGVTLAYLARDREDVDAVLETAGRLGARILKPGAATFWGGYGGYFADPDGFVWEVAYNPFWTMDRDGHVRL